MERLATERLTAERLTMERLATETLAAETLAAETLATKTLATFTIYGSATFVLVDAATGDETRVPLAAGTALRWPNERYTHRVDAPPGAARALLGPASRRGGLGLEGVGFVVETIDDGNFHDAATRWVQGTDAEYGPIGDWDTSRVTNMASAFRHAATFNANIRDWDTSKVTDMSWMFQGAAYLLENPEEGFDPDIGDWDTSKVMDMRMIFSGAPAFNTDIGDWDTSSVTDMNYMFNSARAFNQDIRAWDTSKVMDMRNMFSNADAFNQDIGGWDTSKVMDMSRMFDMSFAFSAVVFDADIGGWDVSAVTDMGGMFDGADAFDQSLQRAHGQAARVAGELDIGGMTLADAVDYSDVFAATVAAIAGADAGDVEVTISVDGVIVVAFFVNAASVSRGRDRRDTGERLTPEAVAEEVVAQAEALDVADAFADVVVIGGGGAGAVVGATTRPPSSRRRRRYGKDPCNKKSSREEEEVPQVRKEGPNAVPVGLDEQVPLEDVPAVQRRALQEGGRLRVEEGQCVASSVVSCKKQKKEKKCTKAGCAWNAKRGVRGLREAEEIKKCKKAGCKWKKSKKKCLATKK
ncbi:serine-type endopeptidase [Aureococcus anophagefferens]|nr:serine-type endopeptidase [Aureococcus anophagefferens]